MSTTQQSPAPKGGKEMKETERIEAPMAGPGRGPMGVGAGPFRPANRTHH